MITHLAARRYRCFHDWQQVALGQLTLIYGENGAGKSALLRLLPWLAASGRQPLPTLDLRWPGLQGATWDELCGPADGAEVPEQPGWWGKDHDYRESDLAVGLRMDDWTLSWRFHRQTPYVSPWLDVLDVRHGSGPLWTLKAWDSQSAEARTHRFSWSGANEMMRFDGLVPRSSSSGPALEPIADALAGVRWLGPQRVGPNRVGERSDLIPLPLDGDGASAQAIALSDLAVLEGVSAWYQDHHKAPIGVAYGDEGDRLVVRRIEQDAMPFSTVGEGLQQAFSVLVGAEQLRANGGLLAVENPESSLCHRLQRALADQFVAVARAQPHAQFLIETHSEIFLLSALIAAVEHGVSVRLHWVEAAPGAGAQVREVELDADGRPRDTTLTDAFSTIGAQRRALINARAHRGRVK